MANDKLLNRHQLRALADLARDPDAFMRGIGPATLSLLRKRGLVGKQVTRGDDGRQKTMSPITDAGRALLKAQPAFVADDTPEPMALEYGEGAA